MTKSTDGEGRGRAFGCLNEGRGRARRTATGAEEGYQWLRGNRDLIDRQRDIREERSVNHIRQSRFCGMQYTEGAAIGVFMSACRYEVRSVFLMSKLC